MHLLWSAMLMMSMGVSTVNAEVLRPEDLLEGGRILQFEGGVGLKPSPDGELVMFDLSSDSEELTEEFAGQVFTATGYPIGLLNRAHVLNLRSRQLSRVGTGSGIAWGGSWSPDGQRYAFYSDRTNEPAVWIWERSSQQVRQLRGPVARVGMLWHAPLWSPDGNWLVYPAVPEGMTFHELNLLGEKYRRWLARDEKVTPDRNSVEVTVQSTLSRDASEQKGADTSVQMRNTDEAGSFSGRDSDLFLVDLVRVNVDDGRIVRVAKQVHAQQYALSPDGQWLAAFDRLGIDGYGMLRYALRVYPSEGGPARTLDSSVGGTNTYSFFSWSPKSDRLAYVSWKGHSNRAHAYLVTLDGERTEAPTPPGREGMYFPNQAPIWSIDGSQFFLIDRATSGFSAAGRVPNGTLTAFSADGGHARVLVNSGERTVDQVVVMPDLHRAWTPDGGRSVIIVTHNQNTGKDGFFCVDVRTGQLRPLVELDATIHRPVVAVEARRQLLFTREDAARPQDLWSLSVDTRKSVQLTQLHPRLSGKAMGHSRLIRWTSQLGEPLRGALLLPANYQPGRRYPLIVQVYGGNYGSQYVNRFGVFATSAQFNSQLFAAHGYAVLYPDIPLHDFTPLKDYASAVLPGIDKVIELGIADPAKLALTGQSFGGYGTLALLTQTTRFKAGIATNSAPSNLFAAYPSPDVDWMNYYEHDQSRMGGTPWEQHQRYLDNSPFFFFDKITTPLLIQRGDQDPVSLDSRAVFNSLKRLGKEVVFLEYGREGHALQRPRHIIDYWNRVYEFLDRYIEVDPAEPMSKRRQHLPSERQ